MLCSANKLTACPWMQQHKHLVVCHTQPDLSLLRVYLVAAVGDSGARAVTLAYYDAYFYYMQTIHYTYENSFCVNYTYENSFCVTIFNLKKVVFKRARTCLIWSSLLFSFVFFNSSDFSFFFKTEIKLDFNFSKRCNVKGSFYFSTFSNSLNLRKKAYFILKGC